MAKGRETGVDHLPEHIGRYQILGLLGTGGMAEILLARIHGPSGFERPVVIKRILPHLAREKRFRDMFLDEARIVAGIRHQNVVHVHELGEERDQLYLVMEYLEGESASSLARRLAAARKLLNFGLCAHLMAETGAGLHAAHELRGHDGESKGLVHRDVSPANVFLTYGGEVKMIDFGIAVAADRVSRTEAGQVKGKYAYMSPEQCMGLQLDRRSDVFSMGTVLYELSTCRRLFKRQSDMLTLQAICHEEVRPPSEVVPEYPPELERIVLRALAKRPEDRYQTALEMRRDLIEVARALNGSKIPEESLAKVMRRLFSDRIDEKRGMLNKLRAGEDLTKVPAADIEDGVEPEDVQAGALAQVSMLHSVTLAANSPLRPGHDTGTGSGVEGTEAREDSISVSVVPPGLPRRKAWWVGGLAAAALVVLGTVVLTPMGGRPAGAESQPRRAAPPPDATIELSVSTEPPGAEIVFDGVDRGATPVSFEVDRSDAQMILQVSKAGFQVREESVRPDRDQRLRLSLVATATPEPALETTPEPAPETTPAPKSAVERRPRRSRPAPREEPAMARSTQDEPKSSPPPPAPRSSPAPAEPEEPKEEENPYSRFN